MIYSWFHLFYALADLLECHLHLVTFPSSMHAKPHPITWIGVVFRPWNHPNPNGDRNHDHNHNSNSPKWTEASAEPFANKFANRCSTESVWCLLFCELNLVNTLGGYIVYIISGVYLRFFLSPSCFTSHLISVNRGCNNWSPKALCIVHKISLQCSLCANIIAPGASFHTLTFNTSINIRSKNRRIGSIQIISVPDSGMKVLLSPSTYECRLQKVCPTS